MSEQKIDRLPPQNTEAEQSVLGALMMDKNAIYKVSDILVPGDFYREAHNIIYSTMLDLVEKGQPTDVLSLTNRLEETKKLEKIGGSSYLATLANFVSTAGNIVHYAQIVHRKRTLRALIEAASQINELGYNENENVDHLLDEAEQKVFSISQRSLTQDFTSVKSHLEGAFERLEQLHEGKGNVRGIPTGYKDLDNIIGGLHKADLVILAARPSLGKTSLALNIAKNVAFQQKVPVGIFSLEMSKHDIVDRLIAVEGKVDLWKMRTGNLKKDGPENDFSKIAQSLSSLSETPIFIDDAPSPTVMQMRTMGRRLQAEHGLGLLIVDYLQLIQPKTNSDSMVQQITETSRGLKALARELDIPVLALSQLSRAVESRPNQMPRLADLRESGSIEQDADLVMFIYREDKVKENSNKQNIAKIVVAKHRNGPIGDIELYFNEKYTSFDNLEKRFN